MSRIAGDSASPAGTAVGGTSDKLFAIEQRGISIVGPQERHGRPRDLFWMWLGSNLNVFYPVNGALVIYLGLSFSQSVAAIIIGNLIFFAVGLTSLQGPKTGTATFAVSRAAYGQNGGRGLSFFNWVTCVGFEASGMALIVLAGLALLDSAGVAASTWLKILLLVVAMCIQVFLPLFGHQTIIVVQRYLAYLLVPLTEVEILDDWQVLGLAGTGSKSLVLHDVFIPEHRSVMVSDLFAGTPPGALVHPDYPVLRAPRGFLVSYSLPPVAIALGRRALEIACAALSGRVSRGVTKVAESEVVQMVIGEAAAAIDVATLLLHTGRESSTAAVTSGRKITEAEALRARRDMVYAQHQVGWALDRLCELDGARWVYNRDKLGAIRRDVMTILTHHAASRQAAMAPYGRMLLAQGGV